MDTCTHNSFPFIVVTVMGITKRPQRPHDHLEVAGGIGADMLRLLNGLVKRVFDGFDLVQIRAGEVNHYLEDLMPLIYPWCNRHKIQQGPPPQ
jgi:hypothetical protein